MKFDFSEKQYKFFKNEFDIGENEIDIASKEESKEELLELYDKLCDIEVDETIKADGGNGKLSERGKTAETLVTLMGNNREFIPIENEE
ncbi:MAG: hypothetical protein LBN42_03715 [Oscillospiraceae bacterium]|jgi:hypothetical protein|nr:hypothetical protein [Oscillospiraceae bacterium]